MEKATTDEIKKVGSRIFDLTGRDPTGRSAFADAFVKIYEGVSSDELERIRDRYIYNDKTYENKNPDLDIVTAKASYDDEKHLFAYYNDGKDCFGELTITSCKDYRLGDNEVLIAPEAYKSKLFCLFSGTLFGETNNAIYEGKKTVIAKLLPNWKEAL